MWTPQIPTCCCDWTNGAVPGTERDGRAHLSNPLFQNWDCWVDSVLCSVPSKSWALQHVCLWFYHLRCLDQLDLCPAAGSAALVSSTVNYGTTSINLPFGFSWRLRAQTRLVNGKAFSKHQLILIKCPLALKWSWSYSPHCSEESRPLTHLPFL